MEEESTHIPSISVRTLGNASNKESSAQLAYTTQEMVTHQLRAEREGRFDLAYQVPFSTTDHVDSSRPSPANSIGAARTIEAANARAERKIDACIVFLIFEEQS
jgi:hypothetical protein